MTLKNRNNVSSGKGRLVTKRLFFVVERIDVRVGSPNHAAYFIQNMPQRGFVTLFFN